MKCCVSGIQYKVFGYKAKQVRDNIHSADLVNAFWHFYKAPRAGEVYNMGGARQNSCSMLEAIELCEKITGKKMDWQYVEENRIGDHIWYITCYKKFREHYPEWDQKYYLETTLREIHSQWEE
jgi:CDP-paratose 2-epimerase